MPIAAGHHGQATRLAVATVALAAGLPFLAACGDLQLTEAAHESAASSHRTRISISTAGVTIDARDAAVADLLRALESTRAVEIVWQSEPAGTVSVRAREQPLEKVLDAILREHGYTLQLGNPPRLWLHGKGETSVLRQDEPAPAHRDQRLDEMLHATKADCHVALQSLADFVVSTAHAAERSVAILQVGEDCGSSALPIMQPALQDPNPTIRQATLEAIGSMRGPEAIAALAQGIDDPHVAVREAAVEALAEQTASAATELLWRALLDEDADIRMLATARLDERRGDPSGVQQRDSPSSP